MTFRSSALLLALALVLAAAGHGRADEVILVSGVKFEGRIESEKCPRCAGSGSLKCEACAGAGRVRNQGGEAKCGDCTGAGRVKCAGCGGLGVAGDSVRLRMRGGTVSFRRDEVERLVWKEVDPASILKVSDLYKLARGKLDEKDARQQFELGEWCVEKELDAQARGHLEAAVKLDAAYADRAEPHLKTLARRDETRAVEALLAALKLLEKSDPVEGGLALRELRRRFADTELVRRAELQRDVIKQHFPKLAGHGESLAELIRWTEDVRAAECPACKGTGRAACPDCAGGGGGPCGDCAGTGKSICPVCEGNALVTCTKCYGTGNAGSGTMGYPMKGGCTKCKGHGEILCDVCAGRGWRACRRCAGTGEAPGACLACAGAGQRACADCGGTGVRTVTEFSWEAPPVRGPGDVRVVGTGTGARGWQGRFSGADITVMPAGALYRGALEQNAATELGKKPVLVAVTLDNRKGRKMLRFRPAKGTLRGVTREHEQVRILDLAGLLAAGAGGRQGQLMARHAGDADCLPGAKACLLAAFPEGTGIEDFPALFWVVEGSDEPVRLDPIRLAEDEVKALRDSLK